MLKIAFVFSLLVCVTHVCQCRADIERAWYVPPNEERIPDTFERIRSNLLVEIERLQRVLDKNGGTDPKHGPRTELMLRNLREILEGIERREKVRKENELRLKGTEWYLRGLPGS